jgi:hypothetical protein
MMYCAIPDTANSKNLLSSESEQIVVSYNMSTNKLLFLIANKKIQSIGFSQISIKFLFAYSRFQLLISCFTLENGKLTNCYINYLNGSISTFNIIILFAVLLRKRDMLTIEHRFNSQVQTETFQILR